MGRDSSPAAGHQAGPGMESIDILVNGEKRSVPAGISIVGLLAALGLDPSRVAVELNREIVRQDAWSEARLAEGARLEIVQFVGGG